VGTGRRSPNVEVVLQPLGSTPLPSAGHSTPKLLDNSTARFIIVSVWRTSSSISKPRAILGALTFWKLYRRYIPHIPRIAVYGEVVLNVEDGMKSPYAVNLHNAVTVSQQRLGTPVRRLLYPGFSRRREWYR